jgi:hypothetical protein
LRTAASGLIILFQLRHFLERCVRISFRGFLATLAADEDGFVVEREFDQDTH